MCERSLCAQVTVASAAELLLLADQHSADLLKASAMDMILTRAHDVMATPGWKTLSQQGPHILAEAFGRLATSPPQQSPARECQGMWEFVGSVCICLAGQWLFFHFRDSLFSGWW